MSRIKLSTLNRLTQYFVLTIPLAWFLQWALSDNFTQSILGGETVVEPDERCLELDLARFELWSEDVQGGSRDAADASLLELEARLRRLAFSVASCAPRRSRGARQPLGTGGTPAGRSGWPFSSPRITRSR